MRASAHRQAGSSPNAHDVSVWEEGTAVTRRGSIGRHVLGVPEEFIGRWLRRHVVVGSEVFDGLTRCWFRPYSPEVSDGFTGKWLRRHVERGSEAADGSHEKVSADAFLYTLMG